MRRARKSLVFLGASALALFLTIQLRGDDIRLATNVSLSAPVRAGNSNYDLAQAQIFTKTLYYVNNQYFDKTRLDPRRMLVGALDFLQRDVPEILVDRFPEQDPKQVTVRVNGEQKTFPVERVDSPWTLRSTLQDIFRFIQPRLQPVAAKDAARHLVEIEMTATNGMLYTLDPHSVLLDVDSYKDMRTTTQGKFGGLGIVIEMDRKGRILVKKPMPDTPAIRAGLKAKDHIVRINNESTINMTLQEAVDRLRGEVGAPVDVYIDRASAPAAKKFTIVRDFIHPPAIDPPPRVLTVPASAGQPAAKIGYFRVISFSANTESDLNRALAMFEREKVKGIIMDLRGNPGGLYDQAQKVADAFIESGVLVSMVGVGGAQRKDEHATRNGDSKVPLAVLVSQNSASASEIVAGAIKNLDRGVIIGETTFGKGSVQMLFDIPSPVPFGDKPEDDKLGLKLTTAQYLTPGDISIQGVGVTPDVELVRMRVEKKNDEAWINLQSSTRRRQESDYEWHLVSPSVRTGTKPEEIVSYLYVPSAAELRRKANQDEIDTDALDDDESDNVEPEEDRIDFPITLARDFLAQARTPRRLDLVSASKALFDKVRVDEDKHLAAALEKLGVDWNAGPGNQGPGQIQVTLAATTGEAQVKAGNTIKIRGTVKNVGTTTACRVRAVLKSDNPLFDENEMVFGRIAPGGSKTYDLTVRAPKSSLTRTDVIRADMSGQGTLTANSPEMTLHIEGKAHPLFAYSYQTIDDVVGNRDGQVQRGERVRTLVKVKNIGQGAALRTEAILRNGSGQEGILISAGRFETKDLAPGASRTFTFVYEVGSDFRGDEYQLDLVVADTVLGESVSDKIKVKLAPAGPAPATEDQPVTITRSEAALREAPADKALVVGHAPKGTVWKSTGRIGAFQRVEIESGRPAFVATADVAPGGAVHGSFVPEWQVTPPVLTVSAPPVVPGNTVHIKATASDDNGVKDVYIRVWNRDSKLPPKKVFYLPNKGIKTRLAFETDVPLWPGSNLVQVFARETNEIQSVQTVVVLDRGAPAVVQKTATQPAK
ncbi:MAG TPA: MXAN_5808 family serine peptidase [Polyangia bacterium]|nr:MXAN_5808 family serine peptidase [Polyangia bacterium]